MRDRLKFIATLLLALLILPVTCFALQKGDEFPKLSGQTLETDNFDFAQLKGTPFILKIGTTWCPSCKEQSTAIAEIGNLLTKHGIKYVDVYVQEPVAVVKKSLTNSKMKPADFVLIDQGEIAKRFNLYTIPRMIIVDQHFNLHSDTGPLTKDELTSEINQLLATQR